MPSRAEQETTVTQLRGGDTYVFTANPVHLRALRKRVEAGTVTERSGDDVSGEFIIPAGLFDPLKGFKRRSRPMTDAEKSAAAERLKTYRLSGAKHTTD